MNRKPDLNLKQAPKKRAGSAVSEIKAFGFSLAHILYVLLVLSVAGYIFTHSVYLAFAGFATLVILFFSDFDFRDLKQSAIELVAALAFAVVAWLALGFVLQTDSPINVVTSCSMLPNLQRGDLVFIRGGVENVPAVSASVRELQNAKIHNALCLAGNNPVVCTDAVIIANKTIPASLNNDIIVFNPRPTGPGLIIHRAFLKAETEQGVFFITKGDNNAGIDQQNQRFEFVSEKDVKGRVVLKIPYAGYLKLLLFLQFDVPAGCDTVLARVNSLPLGAGSP